MEYETIIGLEVHAQLNTKSKMFCRCSAEYANASPNTHVCPVCLGMPGVLPVINKQAVEFTIMTGLALNGQIAGFSKFDRKNYPYPDLMKGYQVSQFDAPISSGGWLEFDVDGSRKRAGITRVHLEEDVAKLIHHNDTGEEPHSLVDVNRAGSALMEVVGEPDLRSPEEARQYLIKLRSILRYLGVSMANMEEGSFRVDANISIRPVGEKEYLTKIEVKNMNSFKAVYKALEYEAKRQRQALAKGEKLTQETRGWIEDKGKTISQRSKEYAHDYRYFPEPDLPPLQIDDKWVTEIKAKLPELAEVRRDRFMEQYGLPLYDANLLTSAKEMAEYYEAAVKAAPDMPNKDKEISNWLLGSVSAIMNSENVDIAEFGQKVSPKNLGVLALLQSKGEVSAAAAKTVLTEMFKTGGEASATLKKLGLAQMSDTSELEEVATGVIKENPAAVADYKAGKEQAVKFLVGQLMRATRGRAEPNLAAEVIKKKLGEG